MSPLDDSLRSTLTSRTEQLDLPPGFLDGVERRARGLRRRRVAATVAGSALAVTALGVGGPVVASLVTSSPTDRAPSATAPPSPSEVSYALDPADPWDFRGDASALGNGTGETVEREWAVRHQAGVSVELVPLYAEVFEPSGTTTVVFVARGGDAADWHWGVAQSSESGPEFLVDTPLEALDEALPVALPGDEVARLLVVAAPGTTVEYARDAASEWTSAGRDGIGLTALEGDPAADRFRVIAPDGGTVVEEAAPDAPLTSGASHDEGPGTETPVDVDPAPYAWSTADPWAYRGPAEATQHPGLAGEDERLFTEAHGAGWGTRPLLLAEQPDGLSVLMVLHTRDGEAIVTTTWQRQDVAPRQSEQDVADGQLLLQSYLPQSDGSGVLVALAAPRTGAIETDVRGAEQGANEQGWTLWSLPAGAPAGSVLLYSEGDGLLFHSEPARRS
ncbi:MAG TPA: hypothetical protein VNU26_04145 [Mycobacteriales bacterium]|nr:hypothetical protein [Mycobacteriales bacterium]